MRTFNLLCSSAPWLKEQYPWTGSLPRARNGFARGHFCGRRPEKQKQHLALWLAGCLPLADVVQDRHRRHPKEKERANERTSVPISPLEERPLATTAV